VAGPASGSRQLSWCRRGASGRSVTPGPGARAESCSDILNFQLGKFQVLRCSPAGALPGPAGHRREITAWSAVLTRRNPGRQLELEHCSLVTFIESKSTCQWAGSPTHSLTRESVLPPVNLTRSLNY
jgi:hypothetical protein